jgi:hypothetical protein
VPARPSDKDKVRVKTKSLGLPSALPNHWKSVGLPSANNLILNNLIGLRNVEIVCSLTARERTH